MAKKVANPFLPTSRDEAIACLDAICALRRQSETLQAALDIRIAQATKQIGAAREPLEEEIRLRMKGLAAWAEANRNELLQGDARSVALPSGVIGWRWGNPTVTVDKGMEEAVIRQLRQQRLRRFLRVKTEIAKDVILAAGADAIRRVRGLSIKQREVFFAEAPDVRTPEAAPSRVPSEGAA